MVLITLRLLVFTIFICGPPVKISPTLIFTSLAMPLASLYTLAVFNCSWATATCAASCVNWFCRAVTLVCAVNNCTSVPIPFSHKFFWRSYKLFASANCVLIPTLCCFTAATCCCCMALSRRNSS